MPVQQLSCGRIDWVYFVSHPIMQEITTVPPYPFMVATAGTIASALGGVLSCDSGGTAA